MAVPALISFGCASYILSTFFAGEPDDACENAKHDAHHRAYPHLAEHKRPDTVQVDGHSARPRAKVVVDCVPTFSPMSITGGMNTAAANSASGVSCRKT